MYRQDDLVGRSWPEVATSSRPAAGVGTLVPPLPRTGRPSVTDARETGRITLADLPRPGTRPAVRPSAVPVPRPAGDDGTPGDHLATPGTALDPADAPGGDPAEDPAAGTAAPVRELRRPGGRLRLPAAPGRRPALLLAALVVGALLAALPGGGPSGPVTAASGLDYGLGMEADSGFAGGVDLAGGRGEISQAEAEARLSEIAASRAARQPKFVLPTQGRLTTCFCTRWGSMHWGLDLAAPLGTPILAATDGVVLRAGAASGYGKAVYIQDADGDVHVYGHMRYLYVEAGDVVSAGDLIAKVGSEGQSTGPHLHYEIHQGGMNGKPTDPAGWLARHGVTL